MRNPKTLTYGSLSARLSKNGFALVITLSLMMLLVIVAVGLLTLSTISLRSSSSQEAMAIARANARMAMMLAIGDLQKQTGPDQRVTLTSGTPLTTGGSTPQNPTWTGAVNVNNLDPKSDPKASTFNWLVSGVNPDPGKTLTKSLEWGKGDALHLGTYRKSGSTTDVELLSPVINMTQGTKKGRYAYWIGDEGTKARVDIARPEGNNPADRERLARAQSPLEYGLSNLGSTWRDFGPGGTIKKDSLISIDTAALAAEQVTIPTEFFNDITTGGFGLPCNVVDGGMKADLSLIFDKSQKSKKFATTYFGTNTPSTSTHNGASIEMFSTAKDPKKFFLSDTLSKNGSVQVGPNWGILWNYANLWRNVSNQQMTLTGLYPTPWSDLRLKDWLPYTNNNTGTYSNDLQHTNSSVAPVVSTFQMGFRLKSELVKAAETGKPALYKAQVEIKPLVGIWNPYNVTIKATPYRFDWALYPFFRLNYAKPNGQDSRLTRLWLRREWGAGAGDMPTAEKKDGGRYFSMETPSVDIRPGEIRLFSITKPVSLKSQSIQKLEAAWSEKGAFVVDLTYKTQNDKKEIVYETREIPAGHVAWFGDIVLQDTLATQKVTTTPPPLETDDFDTEFPGFDHTKNATTWFTLKTGGNSNQNVLFRTTDLWNSHKDASVKVPEPVVSGWKGGASTNTTKEK